MASLLEKLTKDLTSAQKAKDETVVSTLRFLLSAIKNAQIEKRGELTDDEVLAQIQKDAKRHRESIEAFKTAGRDDLSAKEAAELAILKKYLPEQMDAGDVEKIVDEVIAASGASRISDMGKVMGQVMAKVGGKTDGSTVSAIVKKRLTS